MTLLRLGLALATAALAHAQLQFETESGAFQLDARGCVVGYAANTNYFPDARRLIATGDASQDAKTKTTVTIAKDFSVQYFDTFKVLRNLNPKTNGTYVLHQCGTPELTKDLIPEDAKNAAVFSTPVQAWSTALTSPLVFLDMLGLNNRADILDMTYVTSPCLHKLAKCSSTDQFGHTHISSSDAGFKSNITEGNSELHFTDSFGTGKTESSKDVSFDATSDPGLLNRAEWVKFVAVFFNLEPLANTVFDSVQRRLDSVSKLAMGDNALPKKVAFVAYNAEYKSATWNSPESWSVCLECDPNAAYKMDTIKLAGAIPYSEDKKMSLSKVTEAKEAIKGVDCVIDETYAPDPRTYNLTHFLVKFDLEGADVSDYPFLANKCVIRLDKRLGATKYGVGMDWYESAIGHPDVVVKDLVSLIHDGVVGADFKTTYMRNIAKGEVPIVTSAEDCKDPEAVCTKPVLATTTTTAAEASTTTTTTMADHKHDDDHDHDHKHDDKHGEPPSKASPPPTTTTSAKSPASGSFAVSLYKNVFAFVVGSIALALAPIY